MQVQAGSELKPESIRVGWYILPEICRLLARKLFIILYIAFAYIFSLLSYWIYWLLTSIIFIFHDKSLVSKNYFTLDDNFLGTWFLFPPTLDSICTEIVKSAAVVKEDRWPASQCVVFTVTRGQIICADTPDSQAVAQDALMTLSPGRYEKSVEKQLKH